MALSMTLAMHRMSFGGFSRSSGIWDVGLAYVVATPESGTCATGAHLAASQHLAAAAWGGC